MSLISTARETPESLIRNARGGDATALGRLLERYCNYVRLLARAQLGAAVRSRLDASDLVQETLLEAQRDFSRFAGGTERELVAWLRTILVRNLVDQVRRQRAQRRNPDRQESLEALLERSGQAAHEALTAAVASPSAQASRREQAVILADALQRLSADYREVIVLRNLEGLSFDEIAERLDRSAGAARMLWMRALEKLQRLLEAGS